MLPKLYVVAHPRCPYRVIFTDPTGKRIQRNFKNKSEAEIYHRQLLAKASIVGTAGLVMDQEMRAEYFGARQALDGVRLMTAVRYYLRHRPTGLASTPLIEVLCVFLQDKRRSGRAARTVESLKSAVELFLAASEARMASDYTQVEVYQDKIADEIDRRGLIFDPSRLKVLPQGVSIQNLADFIERGSSDQLVTVLWDEASFDVNSKDRQKLEREFQDLCTLARKLDIHLVLVSQLFNDLDNQVRGRVQRLCVCRNLQKYKFFGLFSLPIPIRFRVYYNVAGFTKPQYSHTEIKFGKSPAYACYNTKALLGQHADKFGNLKVAKSGPLQAKPSKPINKTVYLIAALCSALFASL